MNIKVTAWEQKVMLYIYYHSYNREQSNKSFFLDINSNSAEKRDQQLLGFNFGVLQFLPTFRSCIKLEHV